MADNIGFGQRFKVNDKGRVVVWSGNVSMDQVWFDMKLVFCCVRFCFQNSAINTLLTQNSDIKAVK